MGVGAGDGGWGEGVGASGAGTGAGVGVSGAPGGSVMPGRLQPVNASTIISVILTKIIIVLFIFISV
jgi:hypothetical protein